MHNYCILDDRAIIEISGRDRVNFLQPLITNNLQDKNIYSLMLSAQGRFLFDFFIYPEEQSVLIEVHKEQLQAFLKRLNFFKLRSDIKITDRTDDYLVIYAEDSMQGRLKQDPRYNQLKFRGPISNQYAYILESYIKNPCLYLEDKYRWIIPEGSKELIFDKSLPPEYGMDYLNAISYNKGCYTGQEVISRTKYTGVVRKKVCSLSASEDLMPVPLGVEVISNNTVVGIVNSIWRNKGIALIRTEGLNTLFDNIYYVNDIKVNLKLAPWYNNPA